MASIGHGLDRVEQVHAAQQQQDAATRCIDGGEGCVELGVGQARRDDEGQRDRVDEREPLRVQSSVSHGWTGISIGPMSLGSAMGHQSPHSSFPPSTVIVWPVTYNCHAKLP